MKSHRNRGIIAPALLLIVLAASVGFAQGARNGKKKGQQPISTVFPDSSAQRREMIASLKSMELHLAAMEKTMAGLERIAGAQLRLQFDQQKEKVAEKARKKAE